MFHDGEVGDTEVEDDDSDHTTGGTHFDGGSQNLEVDVSTSDGGLVVYCVSGFDSGESGFYGVNLEDGVGGIDWDAGVVV